MRRPLALIAAALLTLAGLTTSPVRAEAATAPTVAFAGRTWTVKTSSGAVGPGPNVFLASNVSVDGSGNLKLAINKVNRKWTTAEVVLNESLGYGTYSWTLGSDVSNLDAQAVLGLDRKSTRLNSSH